MLNTTCTSNLEYAQYNIEIRLTYALKVCLSVNPSFMFPNATENHELARRHHGNKDDDELPTAP
jgi:hypothetical protein